MTPEWLIIYGLLCLVNSDVVRLHPKDTSTSVLAGATGLALIVGGFFWWLLS